MNLALRRGDRAVPPEEAEKIFESAEYGFLSLVSDDRVSLCRAGEFRDSRKIGVHSLRARGRKIDMILRNRARPLRGLPRPRPSPKSLQCATIAPSPSAG